jgi:hypothetical protein
MQTHRRSVIGVGLSMLVALTALVTGLLMVLPSTANAAPHHNRGLTIRTSADPIGAGQSLFIYGQLIGPDNANRRIFLFHRIDPATRFTPIGVARTNSAGFYEFIRADGVVKSNRNWFVLGPHNTHSRTIHEWVSSVVTLNAATTTAMTSQPVNFTGTVYPSHVNQRVLLQEQESTTGNGWKTIDAAHTNGDSAFSITHHFRTAGSYTLRAFFPNDPRNIAGESPSVAVTVQQQQNASFTINGSSQAIANGQSETITGTLYANGSTTVPQPGVPVTLYGRQGTGPFRALQSTQTDSTTGAYSFTTTPLHNTVYYVSAGHKQRTAKLYVGVQDVVSAALVPTTPIKLGDAVKVTGTVTPAHNGHVIYLQEQNAAGQWVDLKAGSLSAASTFAFDYTPGQLGTFNLRVQITGGPWNIGGVSATLPLTVSGIAPVSTLPPAS